MAAERGRGCQARGGTEREWRETSPYRGGLDTGHNMGRCYRRRAARVAKIDESGLRRRRPDPITAAAINNWRNTVHSFIELYQERRPQHPPWRIYFSTRYSRPDYAHYVKCIFNFRERL